MPQRFICPHCHSSVDPQAMESAASGWESYRVCPICDEPVPLAAAADPVVSSGRARPPHSAMIPARAGDCPR